VEMNLEDFSKDKDGSLSESLFFMSAIYTDMKQ
jgi:hypothetical protein